MLRLKSSARLPTPRAIAKREGITLAAAEKELWTTLFQSRKLIIHLLAWGASYGGAELGLDRERNGHGRLVAARTFE